jgi:hypothetical protein
MPKKRPPPVVRLEPVFARDAQRRLRLVIELLTQEAQRQRTVTALPNPEPPRALAASASPGG